MIALRDGLVVFRAPSGDEVTAMDRVNVEIPTGQFVTVIGSNGSGKSTLLNAIAGRVRLNAGRLEIDGEDVTRWPEHRRARVIGRVFQNPYQGTAPALTVAENLRLASLRGSRRGLRQGLGRRERADFRDRLATLGMGIEDRLDAVVGTLSGGQRQAVTLLMATLRTPQILLLDEPTAALDPSAERKIVELVHQIVEGPHLTALMVTHSMEQALELGDRTLMLHRGRVVWDVNGDARVALAPGDLRERFADLARAEA